MNKRIESELARAKGVGVFRADHALTPTNARADELTADVNAFVLLAEDEGGDQVEGMGDFRGGSAARRALAVALQTRLREIGRTARNLPQDQYPGTGEQFRVGSSLRYQQLIDVGHAFLAAIGPIKAAFVARAYPADFDEKLAAQIAAFETASQQKTRGRHQRRGGTAGLKLTMQKARKAIDELDSILSVHYRATNPTLLEVWKLAMRVQKPAYGIGANSSLGSVPSPASSTASAVTRSTHNKDGSTPTPALAGGAESAPGMQDGAAQPQGQVATKGEEVGGLTRVGTPRLEADRLNKRGMA